MGRRGDWDARLLVLEHGFAALSADLVTQQETTLTGEIDQVREILGEGYRLIHRSAREPDGQGVTTASRWPVGQSLEVELHITDRTTLAR